MSDREFTLLFDACQGNFHELTFPADDAASHVPRGRLLRKQAVAVNPNPPPVDHNNRRKWKIALAEWANYSANRLKDTELAQEYVRLLMAAEDYKAGLGRSEHVAEGGCADPRGDMQGGFCPWKYQD